MCLPDAPPGGAFALSSALITISRISLMSRLGCASRMRSRESTGKWPLECGVGEEEKIGFGCGRGRELEEFEGTWDEEEERPRNERAALRYRCRSCNWEVE